MGPRGPDARLRLRALPQPRALAHRGAPGVGRAAAAREGRGGAGVPRDSRAWQLHRSTPGHPYGQDAVRGRRAVRVPGGVRAGAAVEELRGPRGVVGQEEAQGQGLRTGREPGRSAAGRRGARRAARRAHHLLYSGAAPCRGGTGPRGVTDRLARALDRAGAARLIPGNSVRHFADSPAALDAMLALIASARRTIHFENYIIRGDRTGHRFAAALAERARAGVRVRVLYDALGSMGTRRRFWRELRRAGAEVRTFRPLLTSGPFELFSRDHRKLIVIDGREAMMGGLCIGDEWAGDPEHGRLPWRDTMLSVCGPAVAVLEGSFARVWATIGAPLPPDAVAAASEPCGSSALRVIDGVPGQSRAYRAVQLLAAAAQERLWITDAYLVAPPPLYASIVDAAKSGVDVRLLLPGTSDIPIVRNVSRIGYRDLMRAGARIFEYRGPMIHAKTILVDREWARVGSTNLNISSLMGNYELDVVAECDSLTEALAAQFRHDTAQSREIQLLERRRLPARLVHAPSAPAPPTPIRHKRSRRDLQAAAAIALVQVAGGARRMLAGAAATTLAVVGGLLLVFPTAMTIALATAALTSSLLLAAYA